MLQDKKQTILALSTLAPSSLQQRYHCTANSQNLIKEMMKKFHFHFIIKGVTYVIFEGNKWSTAFEGS